MHKLSYFLTGMGVAILVGNATARTNSKPKPLSPQEIAAAYEKNATPGEAHKLFASLEGEWTTKTKEWMAPNAEANESAGTAQFKMLLGGRFLQQEYQGQMMGQPFSGLGIDAYDNLSKHYVSTWMSTAGTGLFVMEGTGSADGRTITFKGQHPEPGAGVMKHRAVWTIPDKDNHSLVMYGSHRGGKEFKMMQIDYTRK